MRFPLLSTRPEQNPGCVRYRHFGAAPCGTIMDMAEEHGFVIEAASDGDYRLRRVPDGLTLRARSWDDVSAACPEFGVRWQAVFIDPACEEQVLAAWGPRPAP